MNHYAVEHRRKKKKCSRGPAGGSGKCCFGKAKRSIGKVKKGQCLRYKRRRK